MVRTLLLPRPTFRRGAQVWVARWVIVGAYSGMAHRVGVGIRATRTSIIYTSLPNFPVRFQKQHLRRIALDLQRSGALAYPFRLPLPSPSPPFPFLLGIRTRLETVPRTRNREPRQKKERRRKQHTHTHLPHKLQPWQKAERARTGATNGQYGCPSMR